jgi:hypothetical protein
MLEQGFGEGSVGDQLGDEAGCVATVLSIAEESSIE